MNYFKKMLVLLLITCNLYAYDNAMVLNGSWKAERYLNQNNKLPYSIFKINLSINNKNKITGNYCFITKWGKKIDCFNDGTNNISGILKNKKAEINFYSSWGGVNGKAIIIFDKKCNMTWKLIKVTNGISYVPKKAFLLKEKNAD